MMRAAVLAIAMLQTGCASDAGEPPDVASGSCETTTFEGAWLTHCMADPARHRIRTALGGKDGPPYRNLRTLIEAEPEAPIAFAMNAGMYDASGMPIGLYIEDGEERVALNGNDGPGNFHLLPNGIFFGSDGVWKVLQTDTYRGQTDVEFATQSGPMLVIDGELHPDISEDGVSRYVRNGVGVDAQGRAHFVITNQAVSFGKLARYFRDELSTANALYLDGSVSALYDPVNERLDTGVPIGPMLVVERRSEGDGRS